MLLSSEIAARLGRLLGIDAGDLLRMQVAYDLWEIDHAKDDLSWIEPVSSAA
jgi:plasmid maintenance system antidote protein VapI